MRHTIRRRASLEVWIAAVVTSCRRRKWTTNRSASCPLMGFPTWRPIQRSEGLAIRGEAREGGIQPGSEEHPPAGRPGARKDERAQHEDRTKGAPAGKLSPYLPLRWWMAIGLRVAKRFDPPFVWGMGADRHLSETMSQALRGRGGLSTPAHQCARPAGDLGHGP